MSLIKNELSEIKKKFAIPRRTKIIGSVETVEIEDVIQDEQVVVTVTNKGYIKRTQEQFFLNVHQIKNLQI